MNSSTLIMYRCTIDQYDSMDCVPCADSLQQFWLDMMYDFSEVYDADWYALVAMWEKGQITIDWTAIASKYNERSTIKWINE